MYVDVGNVFGQNYQNNMLNTAQINIHNPIFNKIKEIRQQPQQNSR
jgi:hypothetical protein